MIRASSFLYTHMLCSQRTLSKSIFVITSWSFLCHSRPACFSAYMDLKRRITKFLSSVLNPSGCSRYTSSFSSPLRKADEMSTLQSSRSPVLQVQGQYGWRTISELVRMFQCNQSRGVVSTLLQHSVPCNVQLIHQRFAWPWIPIFHQWPFGLGAVGQVRTCRFPCSATSSCWAASYHRVPSSLVDSSLC